MSNILPFSYRYCDKEIIGKDFLLEWLEMYPNDLVKNRINQILELPHEYPATWGIKINIETLTMEYELYVYQYHPENYNTISDKTLQKEELQKILNITTNDENPENITMFSYDLEKDILDYANNYYFINNEDGINYGYSTNNKIKQNDYETFNAENIPEKYNTFFNKSYIVNYSKILSLFVAYKHHRNYFGIYYDGVNDTVVYELIQKHLKNIKMPLTYNKNFSISLDLGIDSQLVYRIGIYGLLI